MMRALQQGSSFLVLRSSCSSGDTNWVTKRCSRSSILSPFLKQCDRKWVYSSSLVKDLCLATNVQRLSSSSFTNCQKRVVSVASNRHRAEYDIEEVLYPETGHPLGSVQEGKLKHFGDLPDGLHRTSAIKELTDLALPAAVGQALDPLAQLLETAFIGRLGPVDLASAGVSVSIFNIISKLFNVPLLSVTTSFVAEDISKNASSQFISGFSDNSSPEAFYENNRITYNVGEKLELPSVSTALLLAAIIGAFEALAMYMGAGLFLSMMGISPASSMHSPAQRFLSLRALGAPAVVLSLATQGVFRGFKDTRTPLFCVGIGNLTSIILLPLLAYAFGLGITGAAIATTTSQYITTFLLIWSLSKKAVVLPPRIEDLQFAGYIKSGGLLLSRTLSVIITMTIGTSMAARLGPMAMAAHQICLQIWLAVSLLSDALALSAQALIASSFAKHDFRRVTEVTYCVLKAGLLSGVVLAVVLFVSFGNLVELFTKDAELLHIVRAGVLFVSSTQPINALAFIFDGLHYGVSDFAYAAYAMMVVGLISSVFLLYAPSRFGITGVWWGLTLFMTLRMAAGIMRLCWRSGPWWFLQDGIKYEHSNKSDSMLSAGADPNEPTSI